MPRGIPNTKDTDELKTDSGTEITPQENALEENMALKKQMAMMQGEISRIGGLLSKFSKKTGVKLEPKPELHDADFVLAATEDGKVIIDWKKKPGSSVVTNERGQDLDLQFIIYKTEDGEEHEMSYQLFKQLRKMHKVPAKAENFLMPNEFNQWIPAKKYKYNEDIWMIVGKFDANGNRDYSEGRKIAVKFYVLNP